MDRRSSLWTAVILFLALFSTGCLFRSHKVPKRITPANLREATLAELVNEINQKAAAIKTLNATVDINTSVGGAKKGKVTEYTEIRGYILVRKPDQLRMIGLFPVVRNRAFDMVSDNAGFKLYIPSQNKFIVGPPDVTQPSTNPLENLRPGVIYDALLLHAVDPADHIAVLENGTEVVKDEKSKKDVTFPTYIVDILKRGQEGWYLERKVIFSRTDLQPNRQLVYDKSGNLVTEARYDDYETYDGVQLPSSITIVRPEEEYTIGLKVLKLNVNKALKDEQFVLNQPAGSRLVRLNGTGYNERPMPGGGVQKK